MQLVTYVASPHPMVAGGPDPILYAVKLPWLLLVAMDGEKQIWYREGSPAGSEANPYAGVMPCALTNPKSTN